MTIPLITVLSSTMAITALILLAGAKDKACRVASVAAVVAAVWLASVPYVSFIARNTPAVLASILVVTLLVAALVLVFRADRSVPVTLLIASSALLAAIHFGLVAT
jgi:hypothetical protein